MGEGLRTAALNALCSGGPWRGGHPCDSWTLTGAEVRRIYELIAADQRVYGRSERRIDRALQLLRKAGLIEYAGTPKRWRVRGE